MSSPIVIHMHRPYGSEEEYIARERFSIEAKSMLLIDQPALPADTAVVFDVTLDNGQKPIRAEGRVVGYEEPQGDRPGGVRVRFRRFGAATKAFIDRAVNGVPEASAPYSSPAVSTPIASTPPITARSVPDAPPLAPQSAVNADPSSVLSSETRLAPTFGSSPNAMPAALPINESNEGDEASGIHKKTGLPYVAAPANREALLARLRGRRVG